MNASADLLMARRAAVEEAIQIEEAALVEVIRLLAMATPWVEWPERLRRALRAALTDAGEGVEARKARWLRRHLFRDADPGWPPLPAASLSPLERRVAERLRADLPGQTPMVKRSDPSPQRGEVGRGERLRRQRLALPQPPPAGRGE